MTIKCTIDQGARTITWALTDCEPVVLDVGRVSEANRDYAIYHGLKQRCTDTMALQAADFGGRIPLAAKRAELAAMVAHLESGASEWNLRAASGGGGRSSLLLQCLVEAYPAKSRESLGKWLKGRSAAERIALANEPRIAEIAARLESQATVNVDTDGLMSELDSIA